MRRVSIITWRQAWRLDPCRSIAVLGALCGLWVFLMSDAILFALLFSAVIVLLMVGGTLVILMNLRNRMT